jgi:hypothetical protein
MVLMRPESCRIQEERLSFLSAGTKDDVIDAMRHDSYEIRIDVDPRLRALLDEVARDDDQIRCAGGEVVCKSSERPSIPRNKTWEVAMKNVVKRDHTRHADARQRNGQGEVHHRRTGKRRPRNPRTDHRLETSRPPRGAGRNAGQAAGCIDSVRRGEDEILARADTAECVRERACVTFRAAHAPRRKRDE